MIASPEEGAAKYFKEGTYIPLLNYRVRRVPQSPYPTRVVIGEYDGWANPPDRPWNLISLANAALGLIYVHGPASWDVDPSDVPPENTTVDGTVTTHLVPTKPLPLTRPLRDIGIPDSVVDRADQFLRPIVDAGYRRHDQPGDPRPYLSEGRIRRNVQSAQQAREQSEASGGGDEQSEDPGELRRAGADDRPDQGDLDVQASANDSDVQESTSDTAEQQAGVATRPPSSGHHGDGESD